MCDVVIQTQIKIVYFPYFTYVEMTTNVSTLFGVIISVHQFEIVLSTSWMSCTIRSGKFLYNISIIILLIEKSDCECYDQKYIIVTHPEDSPRTLNEALKKVIIKIKEFCANNSKN